MNNKQIAIIWALVAFLGVLFVNECRADEMSVWATTGFKSEHVNQGEYHSRGTVDGTHHYRQNNSGFGLEVHLNPDKTIVAGRYMNSIGRQTTYLGLMVQPWHFWQYAKFGATIVVATGYTTNGDPIVFPIPTFTIENKNFGVNIMTIPSVVTSIQLKIKLK